MTAPARRGRPEVDHVAPVRSVRIPDPEWNALKALPGPVAAHIREAIRAYLETHHATETP